MIDVYRHPQNVPALKKCIRCGILNEKLIHFVMTSLNPGPICEICYDECNYYRYLIFTSKEFAEQLYSSRPKIGAFHYAAFLY